MPPYRCRDYDDDGQPIKGGCPRMGRGCEFIHPAEPDWFSVGRLRQKTTIKSASFDLPPDLPTNLPPPTNKGFDSARTSWPQNDSSETPALSSWADNNNTSWSTGPEQSAVRSGPKGGKRGRCKFYDDDGKPIGSRKCKFAEYGKCKFAHPEDDDWATAAPHSQRQSSFGGGGGRGGGGNGGSWSGGQSTWSSTATKTTAAADDVDWTKAVSAAAGWGASADSGSTWDTTGNEGASWGASGADPDRGGWGAAADSGSWGTSTTDSVGWGTAANNTNTGAGWATNPIANDTGSGSGGGGWGTSNSWGAPNDDVGVGSHTASASDTFMNVSTEDAATADNQIDGGWGSTVACGADQQTKTASLLSGNEASAWSTPPATWDQPTSAPVDGENLGESGSVPSAHGGAWGGAISSAGADNAPPPYDAKTRKKGKGKSDWKEPATQDSGWGNNIRRSTSSMSIDSPASPIVPFAPSAHLDDQRRASTDSQRPPRPFINPRQDSRLSMDVAMSPVVGSPAGSWSREPSLVSASSSRRLASKPIEFDPSNPQATQIDIKKRTIAAMRAVGNIDRAEAQLAKLKSLQTSSQYQKVGPYGAAALNSLPVDAKDQLREHKHKLEEALNQLAQYPSLGTVVSQRQVEIDTDQLNAMASDIKSWTDNVKEYLRHVEGSLRKPSEPSEDAPELPRKRRKPEEGEEVETVQYPAGMADLARRVDELESGELRNVLKADIDEPLNQLIADKMASWVKDTGFHTLEEGELVPSLAGPHAEREDRLRGILAGQSARLNEQAQLVAEIYARRTAHDEMCQKLAEENEEMRRRYKQAEESFAQTKLRVQQQREENEALITQMKALVHEPPRPQRAPSITPDGIIDLGKPLIQELVMNEFARSVNELRMSVASALDTQRRMILGRYEQRAMPLDTFMRQFPNFVHTMEQKVAEQQQARRKGVEH